MLRAVGFGDEQSTTADDDTIVDSGSTSGEIGTSDGSPSAGFPTLPKRYRIDAELAAGGFGCVYVATDRTLNREVAIKVLAHTSPGLAARFARESTLTATLEHPAIVPIHDAGTTGDGRPYYVMRHIQGATLKDRIGAAKSYSDRVALLGNLTRAVEAIAFAHSRHVLHRDIKPHNIVVGPFGETFVIDWGLAKHTRSSASDWVAIDDDTSAPAQLTRVGSVLGTPAYMSPEQAAGDELSPASDVYGLGAVLYELVLGRAPYQGDSDAALEQARSGSLRPVAERVPQVAPELAAIVNKATARDASARYPDAAALLKDLQRFADGGLVTAHSYSLGARLLRGYRRRRALVWVSAGALVVLAVTAAVSLLNIVDASRAAQRSEAAAIAQRNRADSQRLLLMEQLATRAADDDPTAAIGWIKRLLDAGRPAAQLALLAESAVSRGVARHVLRPAKMSPATTVAVLRGYEAVTGHADGRLIYWGPRGQRAQLNLGDRVVMLRSRGDRLVAITRDATVHRIRGAGTEHDRQPLGPPRTLAARSLTRCDVSSDLQLAACVSAPDYIVYVARPGRVDAFPGHTADVNAISFSDDNRVLATGGDDQTTRLWSLTGGVHQTFEDHTAQLVDLALSFDGRHIASCGRDRVVRIRDLLTDSTRSLEGHTHACWRVAFGPRAEVLYSAGFDRNVFQWNVASGAKRRLGVLTDNPTQLTVSSDGKHLAVSQNAAQIALFHRGTEGYRTLIGHAANVTDVAMPDGSRLVSSSDDGSARVWRFATNGAVLGSHHDTVVDVAISPDGARGASLGYDGAARVWNLDDRSLVATYLTGSAISGPAFAGDRLFIPHADGSVTVRQQSADDFKLLPASAATCARHRCALSVSDDGVTAAMTRRDSGITDVWAVPTRKVSRLAGPKRTSPAHFAGNAEFYVCTRDGSVYRHRIGTRSVERVSKIRLTGDLPQRILAAAPGQLATLSGSHVQLWNTETGEVRTLSRRVRTPWRGTFSADGKWFGHGGFDSRAHLYSTRDGSERTLHGHRGAVGLVAFSADGRRFFTGGADRQLRLWAVEGDHSAAVYGHQLFVLGVAVATTPAGIQRVLTSDDSGEIRVWNFTAPSDRDGLVRWLQRRTSAEVNFDQPVGTPNRAHENAGGQP